MKTPAERAAAERVRQQDRRARGLCYDCEAPAAEGRTRCAAHLEAGRQKYHAAGRTTREARRARPAPTWPTSPNGNAAWRALEGEVRR